MLLGNGHRKRAIKTFFSTKWNMKIYGAHMNFFPSLEQGQPIHRISAEILFFSSESCFILSRR